MHAVWLIMDTVNFEIVQLHTHIETYQKKDHMQQYLIFSLITCPMYNIQSVFCMKPLFQSLHGCMEELRGCYDDVDFSEIKQTSLQLLDKVLDNLGAKFDLGTCSNVIGTAALRYILSVLRRSKCTLKPPSR